MTVYLAFGAGFLAASLLFICVNLSYRRHSRKKSISQEDRLGKQQDTIQELQTKIALSQIKSHFLYNALNSIYILCGKDLKAGRQAISDLSDYLRANMGFMDSEAPIPFEREMDHVRAYLALEMLRFPEELSYSIVTPVTDFSLPALSVQPLVENAVRHGIVSSGREGILVITTRESEDSFFVTINDNGRGFDPAPFLNVRGKHLSEEDLKHIGIRNVKERLKRQVGGELSINSSPGEGTEVTIKIPKRLQ
ncbi:MAG: histidine kinase [Lachnospiraceae bacterium]|nr:histidine kinase [Lachnospiraceae bacterium]